MARVAVNIRFFYEDILFSSSQGYIPREEAMKIPELRVEENEQRAPTVAVTQRPKKSQKKESDNQEEMIDENDEENGDIEIDDVDNEQIDDLQEDDQQQQMDIEPSDNFPFLDDDDLDNDLSQISRSLSPLRPKFKTKRQKGQLDNFIELPNKKPRKDVKKLDEASELIRKQEKQRKRRQYIKKLNEAQEKATFDKILNETGRKFRQREEREMKQEHNKDQKNFKTLGNVPKFITHEIIGESRTLSLHNTNLFPPYMLYEPEVRMREACEVCHNQIGKYTTKEGKKFCSVPCYKLLSRGK